VIPNGLAAGGKRVLSSFGGFSAGQKAVTLCTVVALIVGGMFFSKWASKPTYAPLYSNLSATDASAIVDKLTSTGTPYQLTDGGQTVLVPQDKVYNLRLTMSGAGLPAGKDTGYALLDKQGLTTSEFMQHVDYQRALEGELASTIGSISGVQTATVHLAVPQKDVFTDDQQKPTASVLVATAPGQQIAAAQVQAIVHLVSSSVVGLDPAQVTVADANGTILSTGGQDGGLGAGDPTRTQQTQAYEQRMDTSLQQMLDQVVGPGHAVVKVTADLNYDQTSTKSQTYVADPKLPPLSQSRTSESYTGSGGAAAGVLGPDNVQVPNGTAGGGNGTYAQSAVTQDNAVGTVTQTTQSAPGSVRKLAVAVLLDSNTTAKVDTGAVQKLVSSAVGIDAKRGDTMAVTALPFDQTTANATKQAAAAAKKVQQRSQLVSTGKTAGLILAVLLLLLGAGRSAKKARRSALTPEEREQLESMGVALTGSKPNALTGAPESEEDGAGPAALGPAPDRSALAAVQERQQKKLDLVSLVERQPEEVAQVLRGWLADRRA
jgi:flagellar M-ring protein FliF